MSVRENIELYGLQDQEGNTHDLAEELGAMHCPSQADAYILDGLPFHAPRWADGHTSILSFNGPPLPDSLIAALDDHPELFPDGILIHWP